MIRKPTVFVLGAGASAPYYFDTNLSERILTALPRDQDSQFLRDILGCGIPADVLKDFVQRLGNAGGSVDEFIVGHPQFRDLGKLVIARAIMPWEDDAVLNTSYSKEVNRDSQRWYQYLFRHMRLSSDGMCGLEQNQLTVVTFNFDRSFERALFRFAVDNCVKDFDEARAREIANTIKVHHVHGILGEPRWLKDVPGARDYNPIDLSSPEALKACASSIRILDDEVERDPAVEAAREALARAEQICFLGFSYHPLNLPKLLKSNWNDKRVIGTFYRMDDGAIPGVTQAFLNYANARIEIDRNDLLTFLKTQTVIHE